MTLKTFFKIMEVGMVLFITMGFGFIIKAVIISLFRFGILR